MKVIAIDGPAGAGKSSVSARLAERLGYMRLDTGALYRAIGLAALRAGVEPCEGEALTELLGPLTVDQIDGAVLLNGSLEGDSLRTPEVSRAASDFASLPSVRAKLLELQGRGIAQALEDVQREIEERDHQDMSREIAPLKRATDARLVDATALTLEEVVEACLVLAHQVFGER